jgi:uncharacterized protein with HEPN domain
MPDDILSDNLNGIADSIELIIIRFSKVNRPDDFVMSSDGVLLLDSICMRLQIIGELLKNIHKNNPATLASYPQIEWPNIMKLRDIISHHYAHVDYELVYDICKNHIPPLKKVIHQIMKDHFS